MVNLTFQDQLVLILSSDSEIHYSGSCYDRIANNAAPTQFYGIASATGSSLLFVSNYRSGSEIKYLTLFNNSASAETFQLAIKNINGLLVIATITLDPYASEYLSKYDLVKKDVLFNLSSYSKLSFISGIGAEMNYTVSIFNYGAKTVNKPIEVKESIKSVVTTVIATGGNPAGSGIEYIAVQNNDNTNPVDFDIVLNDKIIIKRITLLAEGSIYIDRNTIKPSSQSSTSSVNWSDIIGKPTSTPVQIDSSVSNSHSHPNKLLLDSYTQTEANLADAVNKKHSHSNKNTLDMFSESEGSVHYDGVKLATEVDSIINAIIFG